MYKILLVQIMYLKVNLKLILGFSNPNPLFVTIFHCSRTRRQYTVEYIHLTLLTKMAGAPY